MLIKRPRSLFLLVAVFALLIIVWPILAGFLTELLWFDQLGYRVVFITSLTTKIMLGAIAAVVAFAALWANYRIARGSGSSIHSVRFIEIDGERIPAPDFANLIERFAWPGLIVLALFFASSGWSAWEDYLLFRHQTPFGSSDPVFGREIAFYVFTLPFLETFNGWLLGLVAVCFLTAIAVYASRWLQSASGGKPKINLETPQRKHLLAIGAIFFLLIAFERYLQIPGLMFSDSGPVAGACYTDLNVRLPIFRVQIATAVLLAVFAAASVFRKGLGLLWTGLALHALGLVAGFVIPGIVQRLTVTPNELVRETPYIEHNIAATRAAFGLDRIEERELSGELALNIRDIQENRATINNVRLWDQGPLLDTFAQIQEIRTYYEFQSVDNDRYVIDGELQQVMLSARELASQSLPNRNWINERLTFTHGYGLTLGPVDKVTPEGLPQLIIQDIPPVSSIESLKITRPEIYFGELTTEHVYVRTRSKEFDYPSGEQNVFTTYEGEGGIGIGSMWRRLLFATRLGDAKLLLSDDLTEESRVLLRRTVRERLQALAPFLIFDADPYLVISEGRLFWLADAYTTTARYPYSQPAAGGINYIRNSVKAVLDAYHGSVSFYIADNADPMQKTFSAIFPGIFKPLADMPTDLRSHIRYPEDIFRLQTGVYSIYHMDDPQVFYNKEDQWSVASVGDMREGGEGQPLDPYYTVLKIPGESDEEFILMLPFTPRRKDNLASWMVARSDGENYGKLAVYRFPKQKLVFGPRQVVARINQDPDISRQLSLWNQRGSQVIFGTLMVIPVKESLLYIYPLYLRAANGKIPELRRVIVVAENRIAMEPTLDASINRLFGAAAMPAETIADTAPTAAQDAGAAPLPAADPSGSLAQQAQQTYERAVRAQRDGDWARYGEEIKRLGQIIEQMNRK